MTHHGHIESPRNGFELGPASQTFFSDFCRFMGLSINRFLGPVYGHGGCFHKYTFIGTIGRGSFVVPYLTTEGLFWPYMGVKSGLCPKLAKNGRQNWLNRPCRPNLKQCVLGTLSGLVLIRL